MEVSKCMKSIRLQEDQRPAFEEYYEEMMLSTGQTRTTRMITNPRDSGGGVKRTKSPGIHRFAELSITNLIRMDKCQTYA